MTQTMRGIFPVLQTPLDANGELDEASFRREVAFAIEAGAHGLVYPVLASEFQFLSDRERRRMVAIAVGEAAGQIPVVVGVAGPCAAVAVEHASHAAQVGADAVIALPPYIAQASQEEILAYYRAIAQAAERPVFVQHSHPGMAPPFLVRLLREVEHIRYIKEETPPSAHNISAVLDAVGEECWGVFGGALGRWMISEMRRGACGFMPATETTDVYVQIWDAFRSGDEAEARRIFNRLLPLINLAGLLGMRPLLEVLVRRGVLCTTLMRTPGRPELDQDDRRELDVILEDVSPLFRV